MNSLDCTRFSLCPGEDRDWDELVPETERLDTSAHKAKGLLALKARRQRPSRSKLKESLSGKPLPPQVSDSPQTLTQHHFRFALPDYLVLFAANTRSAKRLKH